MDAIQGVRNSTSPASALFSEWYLAEQTAVSRRFQVEWMLFKAYGRVLLRCRHCSRSCSATAVSWEYIE
jgi:hypothetical protein